ncbi:MAG: hypothetical protein JXA82_04450 [Sedimentisphaerales bacterium]|nr:hypothetical protein [Sedimentisphaerales bacterium]
MLRYFVAGHFWLLVTLLLLIGRKAWRAGPTRYSCFGAGSFTPTVYNLILLGTLVITIGCFVVMWKTCDYRDMKRRLEGE